MLLALQAMGTRFELVLDGAGSPSARAAGEGALEAVAECEARLSLFRRDSLISHVNREAAERPVPVDPDTFALLEECARIWRQSGGAFDPGIGRRMQQHGFRGRAPENDGGYAGFGAVELDAAACRVRFMRPGVALDLGAIAKGHALDVAAGVLRGAGVERALLHAGTSTVVAIGAPPGLEGWNVALERGRRAPVVVLSDCALSVSAQRGRRNERGEGHVIDPRSGRPLANEATAAVVASRGALADGWSTALLVLGELPACARAGGIAGLVGDPGGPWRPSGARGPFVPPPGSR